MLTPEDIKRYDRHVLLPEIGFEGQEKLKQAKVLVIGAGGLGCPALLYLVAAGVGTIGIIDFDRVDVSNLQRQVLYTHDDIGLLKADVAAKRLSLLNPLIHIKSYCTALDQTLAVQLFPEYDLILDGTDNFTTRYLVNDACVLMNKPLIYGAIHKYEGQVSVFNVQHIEPGPTYRCLFPQPPQAGSVLNCSENGVLGVLPGIIGTLQATEAIKFITGIGHILSGRLLLINALDMQFSSIQVVRTNSWIDITPKTVDEFLKTDYAYFCGETPQVGVVKTMSAEELKALLEQKHDVQLIDVREIKESPEMNILNDLKIPLSEILDQAGSIPKHKPVIVFCRSGQRSKKAIEILEEKYGFTNLYNLEGGVIAWINKLKSI